MGNFHHTDNYTQLCGPKLLSLSVVLFFYPEETVAGNELLRESILSILSIQAAFVDSHFSHAFDQRYVPSLELSHCRRSLHIPYIEESRQIATHHTVNYPYLLLIFVVAHYFCVFGLSNGQSIVLKNLTASRSTYREEKILSILSIQAAH